MDMWFGPITMNKGNSFTMDQEALKRELSAPPLDAICRPHPHPQEGRVPPCPATTQSMRTTATPPMRSQHNTKPSLSSNGLLFQRPLPTSFLPLLKSTPLLLPPDLTMVLHCLHVLNCNFFRYS